MDSPEVTLKTGHTFNPATQIPAESPKLTYSSLKTLDQVYGCRSALTEQAIEKSEEEWFVDGISFIKDGARRAEYATVNTPSVIEANLCYPTLWPRGLN